MEGRKDPLWTGARERRIWLVAYVVIMLVLTAGAARRIYFLF